MPSKPQLVFFKDIKTVFQTRQLIDIFMIQERNIQTYIQPLFLMVIGHVLNVKSDSNLLSVTEE